MHSLNSLEESLDGVRLFSSRIRATLAAVPDALHPQHSGQWPLWEIPRIALFAKDLVLQKGYGWSWIGPRLQYLGLSHGLWSGPDHWHCSDPVFLPLRKFHMWVIWNPNTRTWHHRIWQKSTPPRTEKEARILGAGATSSSSTLPTRTIKHSTAENPARTWAPFPVALLSNQHPHPL